MLKILKKMMWLGIIIFSLNLLLFGIATVLFPSRSILPELNNFLGQTNSQSVNYLFIGSSRTYTAMNLEVINSHLSLPKEQLRVLGISSVSFPQLYFITKEILENTKPKQHVFVELSNRNEYFEYHPKFLLQEPYLVLKDNLSSLYLLKNFGKRFGTFFSELLKLRKNDFNWNPSGFYPMEEIVKREPAFKERNIEMLRSSMKELEQYNPLKMKDKKMYSDETRELNIYVALLLEMARKKEVDLVFFVPNRLSEQEYNIIIPVLSKIPNENQISPNLNPKFKILMSREYLWDRGHLNQKGSKIYADIVGEIIAKRDSVGMSK